jgi:hypothetical protein
VGGATDDQLVGKAVEMSDDARGKGLEERKEIVSDAGAEEPRVDIGGVGGERDFVAPIVDVDVPSARPDERTDKIAMPRGEHGETERAGATQQAKQHRLGAVVGVVRGRDARSSCSNGRVAKGLQSGRAGPSLEVSAWPDPDVRAVEGDAERDGKALRIIELACGLRAQPVIDAVGDEIVAELGTEVGEDVEQSH